MQLDTQFMWDTFFLALRAVPTTLNITVVTLLFSLPLGFLFGLASYKRIPVFNQIFKVYVSFLRGVPFLLVIFMVYYYLPGVLETFFEKAGISVNVYKMDSIIYVYIVFTLNQSAALAAVFRSALESVPAGQLEAAYAMGLSAFQGYTRIILPQALTSAVPVLCSSTTDLIKSTSLAFAMAVQDITAVAKVAAANNMSYVEAYLDIFFIYIILIVAVEKLFKLLEKRLKIYKAV